MSEADTHSGPRAEVPGPGDFGGTCLVAECRPGPEVIMPETQVFGLPKSASYLYGTWKDEDGTMFRALRGVSASESDFAFAFSAEGGVQLDRLDEKLYTGPTTITRAGDLVTIAASDPDATPTFSFTQDLHDVRWTDGDFVDVEARLMGPGMQWYHPWPEGGGCYTASFKCTSEGTIRGRPVRGFVGHEIHYFPPGRDWMNTVYGERMEICWQQVANEYDDGSFVHGTFAYGADGWGFAMVHDERGFRASNRVEIDAEVRESGYPERITYRFEGESWTWTIEPNGERGGTVAGAPLGADGTCRRDGDPRVVVRSMGNSDWWTDGRYEASRRA